MQNLFIDLLSGKLMGSRFKKSVSMLLFSVLGIILFSQCSNAQNNQSKSSMQDKNPYFSKTAKEKVTVSDEEWKRILPEDVYKIAREKGTEYAFSGKYNKHSELGQYHCKVCGNKLFSSDAKFSSSCGWPSFFEAANKESMIYTPDNSHGMQRIEVQCGRCESHLGHIFDDGPPPTGKRYCINSKVILFEKDDKK
jgi:peptide-methionine (R)-S-oxide reductase